MALKFYKKEAPANKPILTNGIGVQFTTLDNVIGYFATDNAYTQQEFERFMRHQEYGITEITADEFTRDYVEKKNLPRNSGKPWREEITASGLQNNPSPVVPTTQPVNAVAAESPVISEPVKPAVTASTNVNFNPPKGTRKKSPKV